MSTDLDLNTLGIAPKQKLTKNSLSIQKTSNFNIVSVLFFIISFYSYIFLTVSFIPFSLFVLM